MMNQTSTISPRIALFVDGFYAKSMGKVDGEPELYTVKRSTDDKTIGLVTETGNGLWSWFCYGSKHVCAQPYPRMADAADACVIEHREASAETAEQKTTLKISMLRACAAGTCKKLDREIGNTYNRLDSIETLETVEDAIKDAIAVLQAQLKGARQLG